MNKELTLVIMAAGMGSRYGGLKQLDSFGPSGEIIIDYSIYDAKRAGINKVVFIIKKENLDLFKEKVGDKISKHITVEYAFQELDMLPAGYTVPEGRIKPWGTSHALLCAKANVTTPFIVINADDYYGRETFEVMAEGLRNIDINSSKMQALLAGFSLDQTVSENGTVSRGICRIENGHVTGMDERKVIGVFEDGIKYTLDSENWIDLDSKAVTSMNCFGLMPEFFEVLEKGFPAFLDNNMSDLKSEYLLPESIGKEISSGNMDLKVIDTPSKWFGVTYPEDKAEVVEKIHEMVSEGIYKDNLWT